MQAQVLSSASAPRPILRLPENLINQIAAGEVVERPASCLKELVENSLDAGARRIDIVLKNGGMTEIQVIDDGSGMDAENLERSTERHATSKLSSTDDLENIATFGFRGEALASIASVAEVELRSRTRAMSHALITEIHFGSPQANTPRPAGAPVGTAVTVRNLFARVPARQKFLRSVPTEFSHSARTLKEIALGNPQTAFYLHHQDHLSAQYVHPTRAGRLSEGFRAAWPPIHIQEDADGGTFEAFLSPPDWTQDRGELYLYVNGRAVRNKSWLGAIRHVYADLLGPHHDPSGLLFLDLRRDWIDVNVHPQKLEVRCLRQEMIYAWLTSALRRALARELAAKVFIPPLHRPETMPSPGFVTPEAPLAARAATETPETFEVSQGAVRFLGPSAESYLIGEDVDGIVLFHPQALQEAQCCEALHQAAVAGHVPTQELLVPKILRLTPAQQTTAKRQQILLAQCGFALDIFGDADWMLTTRPAILDESLAEVALVAALRRLELSPDSDADAQRGGLLATIAQHATQRSTGLSPAEAFRSLAKIKKLPIAWTCPQGRPVYFRLSFHSLAKHFERKTTP